MLISKQLQQEIIDAREALGFSRADLAKKACIAESTLWRMETASCNGGGYVMGTFKDDTIDKVAFVLRLGEYRDLVTTDKEANVDSVEVEPKEVPMTYKNHKKEKAVDIYKKIREDLDLLKEDLNSIENEELASVLACIVKDELRTIL